MIASAARDESATSRRGHTGSAGKVTGERVGVVRRRVDDLMHAVVLESVRVVGRAAEGPEEDHHAREAELVPKLADVGRDHPQILGDHRQLAQLLLGGTEDRGAGATLPVTLTCRLRGRRNRPVAGKAAEVVDPEEIRETEHSPHPLDPPPVAVTGQGPASRRAGCPISGRCR